MHSHWKGHIKIPVCSQECPSRVLLIIFKIQILSSAWLYVHSSQILLEIGYYNRNGVDSEGQTRNIRLNV